MIFQVTLKDPDALYDAIDGAVDVELASLGLDEEEQQAIRDIRREKISDVAHKWFEYGEYLTVEIDTENKTCIVLRTSE